MKIDGSKTNVQVWLKGLRLHFFYKLDSFTIIRPFNEKRL